MKGFGKLKLAAWAGLVLVAVSAWAGCGKRESSSEMVRVGYFPNLTHAQVLVGIENGAFQKMLGEKVQIKPFVFNAGPAVVEAIFARELDIAYIGPNPAVNGYVKSKGEALRIIAGAASGGAALVVRPGANIQNHADFAGKKVASPQLGNTQDVALRHYLQANGLQTADKGGTVSVIPMQNADILTTFTQGQIDAAWVPEPWVTRLVKEAGGQIFLDERQLWPNGQFITANVIATKEFLTKHPEMVEKWLAAHVELTDWIRANPEEAQKRVNEELAKHLGKPMPEELLKEAWGRLEFTSDPLPSTLKEEAKQAFELGFLGKEQPDLSGLYDLGPLNKALAAKGKPQVQESQAQR